MPSACGRCVGMLAVCPSDNAPLKALQKPSSRLHWPGPARAHERNHNELQTFTPSIYVSITAIPVCMCHFVHRAWGGI
eukprot:5687359-Amphidinium_carterae.1